MSRFSPGTKRAKIEELYKSGISKESAFLELSPLVRSGIRPWVFLRNENGTRVSKPMSEQLVELEHEISRVYNLIKRSEKMGGEIEKPAPKPKPVKPTPKEIDPEPETEEEIKTPVKAKGKLTKADHRARFLSEWRRLRKFISDTADRTGALPIDSLDTMRPLQAAKALIEEGISADTLVYAMVCHWPKATRDMANVSTVDFHSESEDLGKGFHNLTGYVLKLATARQNVMLIGPAGTGKSHIARQVASLLKTEAHPNGLPYGETPMTPGATRGDLLGRHTINGFVPSQFVEVYAGGGVFNFEEIDASDPSMLIVVNNALASDKLFNSVNGEVYEKHPDFIAVATANTFGLGADAKYTGREKLDLATIDRFRMGRVLVDLDEELAVSLMNS